MFERIVIGWDGSPGARDALTLARCLLRDGGELLAVYAYPLAGSPEMAGFGGWRELLASDAWRTVQTVTAEIDESVRVAALAVPGASPAAALCDVAEEHAADAIVVGSSARGTFGRILAGDVGERLLHGAPCPVAVAPSGFSVTTVSPPRTIGVGFDNQAESQRALALAEEMALERGARVDVLAVIEPSILPRARAGIAFPGYEDAIRDAFAADVEAAVEQLAPGVTAEGEVIAGDPASELAARADHDLDMLVIGSRGYGPLKRVLLGGVSSKLMRISPVPVIVVPRTADVPVPAAA
jgi:nucleotide-binding universal stress UspA family protein